MKRNLTAPLTPSGNRSCCSQLRATVLRAAWLYVWLIASLMKSKSKAKKSSKNGKRYGQDELLERGLSIAMERGQWAIQEGLLRCYPWLKSKQADEISRLVQEAIKFGHWLVDESVGGSTWVYGKTVIDREDFDAQMRARYQWFNGEHLSDLYRHASFVAFKNASM